MDTPRTDDEHGRHLMHEVTVQILLFAFDSLMWLDMYKRVAHYGGFRVGDGNGERLTDLDGLAHASGLWGPRSSLAP